jgi:PAS domain S-box-containing protein
MTNPENSTLKKGKILAVDDEPIVLQLLAAQLNRLSYQVSTADSAAGALKILQRETFDIMITDVLMPDMNGLALMRQAFTIQPDLQCLVVSGQGEIVTAVEAMKTGAINFIPKPVSLMELDASLEKGMEKIRLLRKLQENQLALQKAAEKLSAETTKNKMILEAAGEGILGLDHRGNLTFINPAALAMLHKTHDEVMGKPVTDFVTCSQAAQVKKAAAPSALFPFTPGEPDHLKAERALILEGGTEFIVEYVATEIRNGEERSGMVIVFNDITRRKQVEQELHDYREHLEKIVASRTSELAETNRQLQLDIRARKKAEEEAESRRQQLIEADKLVSLGILVAGVAHEINNPNNFITMNTPILKRAWDDLLPIIEENYALHGDFPVAGIPYSEMRSHIPELFSGILDGSERIRKIVLNLRDYARQGVSDMSQFFDLNQVVNAALVLLANPLKKSTNHLQVQYGQQLPQVKGNFQRAEQVVINLIQNACQSIASPDKRISIATRHDREKNRVIVEVNDEGCGIPRKNLKLIQDPFYTTKRDKGGSGLGLSISAGIMEEHGGRLEFTSDTEKGTVVKAIFPAAGRP